jgi:pimeloyl-ACP methyl ester carboxylesterase
MREHTVMFGDESPLVGIITEPDTGVRENVPVFLFLNAGLDHRVGPNRLYVTLARRLVEEGVASLRFDFSGIGDSPVSRSLDASADRGVNEARQAMSFLERSVGADAFVPLGICSGADIAFALAGADERVAGAVLINPTTIPSEHSEAQSREAWRRAQAHHHGSRLADWKSWTRVLTGRSDLPGLFRSTLRLTRRAFRLPAVPVRNADLGLLPELGLRGVELLAVFSEGDLGLELLATHVGSFENLAPMNRFQLEVVPDTDHLLTPLCDQQRIETLVVDWAARCLSGHSSARGNHVRERRASPIR